MKLFESLNEIHQGVFYFIQEFIRANKRSPTYREISNGCHIGRTSAYRIVGNLEKFGFVRVDRLLSRGIILLGKESKNEKER